MRVYRVGARYYRALTTASQITKMLFIPDILTTDFAGLLFYFGLGIFEDGMVAEAIAFYSRTQAIWFRRLAELGERVFAVIPIRRSFFVHLLESSSVC